MIEKFLGLFFRLSLVIAIAAALIYVFIPEQARPYFEPRNIIENINSIGVDETSAWDELLLTVETVTMVDSVIVSMSSSCDTYCTPPVWKVWREDTVRVGFRIFDPELRSVILDKPNKQAILNVVDTLIWSKGQIKSQLISPSKKRMYFTLCNCQALNETAIDRDKYIPLLDEMLHDYEPDHILAVKLDIFKNSVGDYNIHLIQGAQLQTDQSWLFNTAENDTPSSTR